MGVPYSFLRAWIVMGVRDLPNLRNSSSHYLGCVTGNRSTVFFGRWDTVVICIIYAGK